MTNESKNSRFKRLAKQRGERVLRDIHLIGNLSNRNNYEYTDQDISKLFRTIEEEIRLSKSRFITKKTRKLDF